MPWIIVGAVVIGIILLVVLDQGPKQVTWDEEDEDDQFYDHC